MINSITSLLNINSKHSTIVSLWCSLVRSASQSPLPDLPVKAIPWYDHLSGSRATVFGFILRDGKLEWSFLLTRVISQIMHTIFLLTRIFYFRQYLFTVLLCSPPASQWQRPNVLEYRVGGYSPGQCILHDLATTTCSKTLTTYITVTVPARDVQNSMVILLYRHGR